MKENLGLTDDELLASICCDIRFQYALHTTHLKDQPVSDHTFSRFRERLYNYELETKLDLLKEEMKSLNEIYSDFMGLYTNIKRMDSLMDASNCKRMSRLEIIYTTVANAMKLLQKRDLTDRIPEELQHYLNADDHNDVIYYCKGDDVSSRIDKVIKEAALAKELLDEDEPRDTSEFQLLIRVLNEQTNTDENGEVTVKDKSEIKSTSLQDPSDPDATYRSKAGKQNKGYVGNIIEKVGKEGDSLIDDIQYDQNVHSDSDFCKEYLENHDDNGEQETMITDGAYNSVANQELAKSKNIDLVSTALTGQQPDEIFKDFHLSVDGKTVISCPMGHIPVKTTYYPKTGVCRAQFENATARIVPIKMPAKQKRKRRH